MVWPGASTALGVTANIWGSYEQNKIHPDKFDLLVYIQKKWYIKPQNLVPWGLQELGQVQAVSSAPDRTVGSNNAVCNKTFLRKEKSNQHISTRQIT